MSNNDGLTASLRVRVFDGARQPIDSGVKLLITIRDGFQNEIFRGYKNGPEVVFDVPFNNNLQDQYTVIISAKGYKDAGFTPVKVDRSIQQVVDLMLISKKWKLDFSGADWQTIKTRRPELYSLLSVGAANEAAAEKRYNNLIKDQPSTVAALLNITTAMAQIHLPQGTPMDYLKTLIWEEMKQDRFFAYADKALIEQVRLASTHGEFAPEPGAAIFHPGATLSYKQVTFGEANVQLTFHEQDSLQIDNIDCVKIEPDIDYFKDLGAHALLEVVPNHITGGLTKPEQVYLLRWTAGQRAGLPQFDPLYTIG
jgi:hypothetical protein